ncbi:MAG TPA: class I SAM-dependent methyltransferase [Bryobacteraceae bacterium]|nr:class I SAM-dependent methyltransferase [Bryobacteraceae bacterium]
MGRFAATARFYQRYREPYPPEFFQAVAKRISLTGQERLVDAACGPAPLAIGFAPFVRSAAGVDPEPRMIAAAAMAAAEARVHIELIEGRMEEVGDRLGNVDVVTIGRALHWLPRQRTLALFERIVAKNGWIIVGGSLPSRASINRPAKVFYRIVRKWSPELAAHRYLLSAERWFAGSRFRKVGEVAIKVRRRITIADMIGRAFSLSTTSPAKLGRKRPHFEQALREGLKPFAADGLLFEEIRAGATIFQ